ncbi:MAG: tetratricopeptide repeat protein [Sneathiella sp.]|nr:tetratricopeptide repeat protein [Sneathiella sp.]
MPQHTRFAASLRTILLATTGLVAAGCNTISDQSAAADPAEQKPAAVSSASSEQKSPETMSFDSLMRVAARTWTKNDAATALGLYATAAKTQPTNPAPMLRIAEIFRKTGRAEDAVTVYDRVLAFDSKNLDAYHGKGYSQLQLKKPYLATQSFAAALAVNGDDATALGGMAVSYDKAGEHEKAQGYYKQAIKIDPDNLNYKSNLALSLALTGKTEQAIAILKVVTADPGATANHRQTLALAYGLAGQSGEAMKYSRMDLSERDAHNNELYFAALNTTSDTQAAVVGDQVKVMQASDDKIVAEGLAAHTDPREPVNPDIIVARQERETLSTDAGRKAPAPMADPKRLVPAPAAPVMMAKAEPEKAAGPKELMPVVTAKAQVPTPKAETAKELKPVSVAPTVVAKTEARDEKPVTFTRKSEPMVSTKNDTSKPVAVAKADPAPAPAREMKAEKKITPAEIAEEPFVADTPEVAAPVASKIAFVPGNMPINGEISAYKPDGGAYFLQIGSYKEKAQAEKGWKILQTQNVDLLDGVAPVINEVDLGADKGGVFYRLQIGGYSDKVQTMRLCGTLRDRNFECFMPTAQKAVAPQSPAPTLAPDQRMVDGGKKAPGKNDTNLIADFKEGFDAL